MTSLISFGLLVIALYPHADEAASGERVFKPILEWKGKAWSEPPSNEGVKAPLTLGEISPTHSANLLHVVSGGDPDIGAGDPLNVGPLQCLLFCARMGPPVLDPTCSSALGYVHHLLDKQFAFDVPSVPQ